MPPRAYSGGRLATLTYAESLAANGAEVELWTNFFPRMALEYASFSRIKIRSGRLAEVRGLHRFDRVVMVPHMGSQQDLLEWARVAEEEGVDHSLLNFESPNWFNSLSGREKPHEDWLGWTAIAESANRIVSLSEEGKKYAEDFYRNSSASHHFVYPSINSKLADRARPRWSNRKRVVMLTRVDGHKGLNYLRHLLSPLLKGYCIRVHLGNGEMDPGDVRRLCSQAKQLGISLELRGAVAGTAKFRLLKSSGLLFFPTDFEGFGIPPLEAAYCGVRALVSDLPVLREYGGSAFSYFQNSAPQNIAENVVDCLRNPPDLDHVARLRDLGKFERAGRELLEILQ